jgi:hypothetical protein
MMPAMNDVAFRRDRSQAAIGKLRERPAELKEEEKNARRQVAYDKAKAVRDELAKELADLYPAFAKKLAELLPRIAANDREIERINYRAFHPERRVCSVPNWLRGACPVGS